MDVEEIGVTPNKVLGAFRTNCVRVTGLDGTDESISGDGMSCVGFRTVGEDQHVLSGVRGASVMSPRLRLRYL